MYAIGAFVLHTFDLKFSVKVWKIFESDCRYRHFLHVWKMIQDYERVLDAYQYNDKCNKIITYLDSKLILENRNIGLLNSISFAVCSRKNMYTKSHLKSNRIFR